MNPLSRRAVDAVARQTSSATAPLKSSSDLQSEIDQLRGELEYRSHFAESLRHFLERISSTDPENTYTAILTNSKDLLLAERASLLVVDERANELVLKAGSGNEDPDRRRGPDKAGRGSCREGCLKRVGRW